MVQATKPIPKSAAILVRHKSLLISVLIVHAGHDEALLRALKAAIAKLPKCDTRAIVEPIIDGLLFMLDPDSGSGACNLWGGLQHVLMLCS
jgi:hypothetical protein